MRRHILFLCIALLLIAGATLAAQSFGAPKYGNIWYFGEGRGLDFNTTPPTPLYDGLGYGGEGLTTIADPTTGEYLLFFDGDLLFRRGDTKFEDGRQLYGRRTASQSAVILPLPGSDRYYYIFYVDDMSPPLTAQLGMFYALVDIEAPPGSNIFVERDVLLDPLATERIAATWVCEDNYYWILSVQRQTNRYLAFKLTQDGVEDGFVDSFSGPRLESGILSDLGALEFSPDGRLLIMSSGGIPRRITELFHFDNTTGRVHSPFGFAAMPFTNDESAKQLSFSPDGRMLYQLSMSGSIQIVQYDLTAGPDISDIFNERTIVETRNPDGQSSGVCGIQLAPDGKIYVAMDYSVRGDGWLGVINNPNAKGLACDFQRTGIEFPNSVGSQICTGLPNHVDTWFSDNPADLCLGPDARITLSDTLICLGESVEISDGSVNLPEEWSWMIVDPGGAMRRFDTRDPGALQFNTPGKHLIRLVVTNRWGASETTRTVEVIAPPVIDAGEDIALCAGASAQLNAETSGGMLIWTPADEYIDDVNSGTPTVYPPASRWYYLDVVSPEGCAARDSVFVRVDTPPTIELTADLTTVCPDAPVRLTAVVQNAERFEWDNADELDDPQSLTPTARPRTNTRYTLTAFNGTCSARAEIEISVNEALDLNIDPVAPICAGELVQLNAAAPAGATLRWTPAELFNDNTIAAPRFTAEESRWVYLRAERDGCAAFDSVFVEVFPRPALTLRAPDSICAGDDIVLNAAADQPGTIAWTPAAGLDDAASFAPTLRLNTSRTLSATFTSVDGCATSAEITVEVTTPTRTGIDVSIDETGVLPGDRITWRLRQSGDRGIVNSVDVDLAFDQSATRIVPGSINSVPGWTFTLTPDVNGGMLHIAGEGPPTDAAELLQWRSDVFLAGINSDGHVAVTPAAMSLRAAVPCFTPGELNAANIEYSPYCLGNARLLTIGAGTFALHAPQPNPAGSGATIRFELGFGTEARLQVFNTLGEVVAELAGGRMAAGEHEVQVPQGLSKGVYLIRLNAGPFSDAQTLVVGE